MFRDVEVSVSVGQLLVFNFPRPLSVELVVVSNAAEEVLWEFIADEFKPSPVIGEHFRSWPIDEAPPEMLAMLSQVQKRLDHELEDHGPRNAPLSQITYGLLPAGYREKRPPLSLKPGEYCVLVFSEQGQGAARFSIAA